MAVNEINKSSVEYTIGSDSIDFRFPNISSSQDYKIKYKRAEDSSLTELDFEGNHYLLDNLCSNTEYHVHVLHVDDGGTETSFFRDKIRTGTTSVELLILGRRIHPGENYVICLTPKQSIPHGDADHSVEKKEFYFDDKAVSSTRKTIILVGGNGSGKTTLVNALANHFLGVEYADNFRIDIAGEKVREGSSKPNIVSYEITPPKTSKFNWTLNIVTVRGFSPEMSDHDRLTIVKQLNSVLCLQQNSCMFCLVIQCNSRYTTDVRGMLEAVRMTLNKMNNVTLVPIFTFYDGGNVNATQILEDAKISFDKNRQFFINNANLFIRNGESVKTWNLRKKTLEDLIIYLDTEQRENLMSKHAHTTGEKKALKSRSNTNSITIEWQGENASYKIKYKDDNGEWREKSTTAQRTTLEYLKGDTNYEIRVMQEMDNGEEILLVKANEKTKMSIAVPYQKFADRIDENSRLLHLRPTHEEVIGKPPQVNVRVYSINVPSIIKEEKTILMLGGQGSGKRTLADAMINYIFGVEYGDEFRFRVTDATYKNGCITLYQITPPKESKLPFKLNIIIVPGFKPNRPKTNNKILSNLGLLLQLGKIRYINFACIVVQAMCRLTKDQRDIFRTATSALGKDVSFLVPLFTFYDGGPINTLDALKSVGVPCLDHLQYSFNNALLFEANELSEAWAKRNKVFEGLFQDMRSIQGMPIETTRDVLKSLTKIYEYSHKEVVLQKKLEKMRIQRELQRQNNTKTNSEISNQNQEKIREPTETLNINCTVCKTTCRKNCSFIRRWLLWVFMIVEAICCKMCCPLTCSLCCKRNIVSSCDSRCKCRLGNHVIERFRYSFNEIPSKPKIQENPQAEIASDDYKSLQQAIESESDFLRKNALCYIESDVLKKMKKHYSPC